jgi:low affinity Fe/Cu permease
MRERFRYFARRTSEYLGSSWAFLSACLVVVVWALVGPLFDFSDTWQMVINTGTTIVTFLMVFLIQHAQNHDARVMQLKLDELLRAVHAARTGMVNLEERSEEELTLLKRELSALNQQTGGTPTDIAPLHPARKAPPKPTGDE